MALSSRDVTQKKRKLVLALTPDIDSEVVSEEKPAKKARHDDLPLPAETLRQAGEASSMGLFKTRSQLMSEKLVLLPDLSKDKTHFRDYLILNREVTNFNQKIVSIGGNLMPNREILTLDPHSNTLQSLYQRLKRIVENISMPLLKVLTRLLTNQFTRGQETENNINCLLATWINEHSDDKSSVISLSDGRKIPVVPLDFFLQHSLGFCRHYSLLGAYLLYRLIEDKLLSGEVYLHRDPAAPKNPHMWVVFKTLVGEIFIIDPIISQHEPLDLDKDSDKLITAYGTEAVARMRNNYCDKIICEQTPVI